MARPRWFVIVTGPDGTPAGITGPLSLAAALGDAGQHRAHGAQALAVNSAGFAPAGQETS